MSLGTIVQYALIVIVNILVAIRKTNQHRKPSSKTTMLLSVHDIIVTVFSKSILLVFTNYQMKGCKFSTLLLSFSIYLRQFNTGIICFISLDRYLYVKLSKKYQIQFKSKTTIVSLLMDFLWPLFQLISTNTTSSKTSSFVNEVVSAIINIFVITLVASLNSATFMALRRYKKQAKTKSSTLNKRLLRLSELYIICFVTFKIPLIPFIILWYNPSVALKTKTVLAVTIFNVSELDAIVNSVIFFSRNRIARSYFMKKLSNRILPL